MTNMFEDSATFLADQFEEFLSETVVYTAIGGGTVSLLMSLAKKPFDIESEPGFIEEVVRHDWLVKAATLIISALAYIPVRGDTIERSNGDIYRVVGDDAGDMHYRETDAFGKGLRIHTVLVTDA